MIDLSSSPTNDAPILDWARSYHARGWCVIPVNPDTKRPCLAHWKPYQHRRPTEHQLRDWFTSKYKALAIVCGVVSGNIGTFDFDSEEKSNWWNTAQPNLAKFLPTEKTTRGIHVLFHCDPVPTQRPKAQKVELLCQGAYFICTPSPGKRWLIPPNGEIPKIEPFSLGLEAFGITQNKGRSSYFTQEAQELIPELEKRQQENKDKKKHLAPSCVNLSELSEDAHARIDEAIRANRPSDVGQRDHCIFTFTRWLKAIPEISDCSAGQLRVIAQRWHENAVAVIATKRFEDSWGDFVYAWNHVRWPKGALLDAAAQKAREDTENPPEAKYYQDPRNQLLVRFCYQLQQIHEHVGGEQLFFLSLRTAAGCIGVSHTEASKRLEMLMADGFIAIVASHTRSFATTYKYVGNETKGMRATHEDAV